MTDEHIHKKGHNSYAVSCCFLLQIRPRGFKTFFMLNSAEHELCPADKYQITKHCNFFLAKKAEHDFFFLLFNMKMPTFVGIFIFINRENFMLS